ncbi:MAG: uroporphyrinogen-III synthase [Candidatus Dormibacteraeota bacterium]|nr:uroporphyrinogen-III synthase [Candidatus Dormibacteraeota bacterium]
MIAILVTRPGGESDPLVQALRQRGYGVHAVPTMQTESADLNLQSLADYDWIVFTSTRGVKALADLPAGPRFAAVGSETARALRARGVEPSHVPANAGGADLGDTLPDVNGKRIALIRASAAATDLPDRLRERGATVEEVIAYRTVEGPAASADLLHLALMDPELGAVVFASGSAVRGFVDLGGSARLPAITIGPRTTSSAREQGFKVIAEAHTQDVSGLANAVVRAFPLEVENDA